MLFRSLQDQADRIVIGIVEPDFERLGLGAGTGEGGQETTITSFHTTLLHQGMVVVGVPYSEPRLVDNSQVSGGTPYGASTIAGTDGSRQPTENELAIAHFQGSHVAKIAAKLAA